MNRHHEEILTQIKKHSGKPTQYTFLDSYLGNTHPRYPINAPTLRTIAKDWMRAHTDLTAQQMSALLTSLIKGVSSTEKCMAGVLLDYARGEPLQFDPILFDRWLDHLEGWAEVDTLCTGRYVEKALPEQWPVFRKLINQLSRSKNLNKRRASLVLFCSPLRFPNDERIASEALKIIDRLKHEKDGMITKAVSWVLRTMEKHHREKLEHYLAKNKDTLPAIAVRETVAKLKTGVKNKKTARS